ncbi:Gfo/Idh/MocA family protein [Roseobacter weihaiensis]|uniref:Gfo/Idh/MocA family protein n=1 Tax=Roseobacter weihaiensis TaxID=2763262 RepID=UPI001D0A115B|nr:Gfo/Idh/MocA family oxidoreductase [Roseobacter sp. H9]
MTPPLRVAGVGAGYFSQFHYGSWARLEEVEIVGVTDLNGQAAQATGLPVFSTLNEMIDRTAPDILDIIVPPEAHAATIKAALAHRVPTIICQKPFCLSLAEAKEMVTAAGRAGTTLIVHENFRFMPWYRAIKSELDAGTIGQVLQATFRLRPGDGQGPRAYLDRQPYFQAMPRFLVHETAVHWIDTFRFLFGDPQAVYADLRRLNPAISGEDAGFILFDHPEDVRAVFDGNRHLDHASDNLRRTMGEALVEGTQGTLRLSGTGQLDRRAFGATDTVTVLPADTWEGFGGDCVHALQSHVVAHLRRQTPLENQARAYCEVIRIKDAIYRSAASNTKVTL